jgi:hypothetical protein
MVLIARSNHAATLMALHQSFGSVARDSELIWLTIGPRIRMTRPYLPDSLESHGGLWREPSKGVAAPRMS